MLTAYKKFETFRNIMKYVVLKKGLQYILHLFLFEIHNKISKHFRYTTVYNDIKKDISFIKYL